MQLDILSFFFFRFQENRPLKTMANVSIKFEKKIGLDGDEVRKTSSICPMPFSLGLLTRGFLNFPCKRKEKQMFISRVRLDYFIL